MQRTVLAVLLSLTWVLSAQASAPDPKQIDALFADFTNNSSPGCALAVIENGKIVYQHGYGSANLDYGIPITPASVFYIASNAKQFTAFSVALLIEQGKLSLEDPITKYFPELPADVYGAVAVGNLIYHTGGIPDYWPLLDLAGRSAEEDVTEMDFLNLMARQKHLRFKPGQQFEYTNSGYVLLAILVQRVSGKALAEFASENMFKPLGMTHTFFRTNPLMIVKGRASGYSFEGGSYREDVTHSNLIGDGGLMTTVGDLFLWDQNFYHNRLGKGSPDLIRLIETPGPANEGMNMYAFGLAITNYKGLKKMNHTGSAFGYKADMTQFPDQKFSVICLCNSDGPKVEPWTIRNKIVDLYLAQSFTRTPTMSTPPPTPHEKPIQLSEQELNRYAGTFKDKTDNEVWKLSVEEGSLTAAVEGIQFHLEPLSRVHFRATDAPQPVDLYFPQDLSMQPKIVELQVGSQPKDTLEPLTPWTPSAAEVSQYAGDYYSGEIDSIFHIGVAEGKLKVSRNQREAVALTSGIEKDKFEMGRFKLVFERDPAGQLTGFSMGDNNISGIRFVRR